ncbi:MAG: transglycosylase domain-containing protein [Holosporales bacterium]|jgi:penicillin-binding protein 1A|nr:transglycosylase domain-containing protein [Holosporales bacterium]
MSAKKDKPKLPPSFHPIAYFIKSFSSLFIGAGILLTAGGLALFLWLNASIPSINSFTSRVRTPSVVIQAADGTVIANYGEFFEEFVSVTDLPPHVVNALLAVEDRRFYAHNGIDIIGLVRAMLQNLRAHRIVQGGSTLTQQLAKNMLISSGFYAVGNRSIRRKLQELILAAKLEARFSKNEILTLYLNRVYFGAATYGIDAASRRYFQKTAKELTLFESAILAGILCAPSRYSPTAHPKKSVERAKIALKYMESSGFIDGSWRDNIDEWEASFIQQSQNKTEKGSRYFADWVFESIPSIIGPIDQDLTVVTTLHPAMQRQSEEICQKYYDEFYEEYKFSQAAVIAMTPTGAVLTMVGGLDYGKSQFNRATLARRQPGSAFKTFVYLSALEAGIDRDEKFDDSAFQQGTWKPGNYKWKELGEISLFEAYVYSVNSVCVRVAKKVGIRNVIKTARRLGITSPLNVDLTLALGSPDITFLELVRAYAPFFNGGFLCQPYGIVEIRDKNGNVLYQRSENKKVRVVKSDPLEYMKAMMRAVIARGTGRAANVSPNVMGKTGSNSSIDAWFLGGWIRSQKSEEKTNGKSDDKADGKADGKTDDNANYDTKEKDDPDAAKPDDKADTEDTSELSPDQILSKCGVVLGVWIGNDSLRQKMAPHSTGGRLPTRIAGSIFKAYANAQQENEEPQIEMLALGSTVASSMNQYLQDKNPPSLLQQEPNDSIFEDKHPPEPPELTEELFNENQAMWIPMTPSQEH